MMILEELSEGMRFVVGKVTPTSTVFIFFGGGYGKNARSYEVTAVSEDGIERHTALWGPRMPVQVIPTRPVEPAAPLTPQQLRLVERFKHGDTQRGDTYGRLRDYCNQRSRSEGLFYFNRDLIRLRDLGILRQGINEGKESPLSYTGRGTKFFLTGRGLHYAMKAGIFDLPEYQTPRTVLE